MRVLHFGALSLALLLVGCGVNDNRFVAPKANGLFPQVLQSGGLPRDFTRFTPNTYTPSYGAIVEGPDKAMWFVDTGTNGLVRMAMDGTSKEYPIPNLYGIPGAIAIAPNANFYILDCAGGITVAGMHGASTSYALPAREVDCGGGDNEAGLAVDSVGNAWTTGIYHVLKITTSGIVKEYPYPGGNEQPNGGQGITAGPSGLMWFVDSASNAVDTINPQTGVIAGYSVPTMGCSVAGPLVWARTGNLWFGCTAQNMIGDITPSGVVSLFPVSYRIPSAILGTTVGPDGNPWFLYGLLVVRLSDDGSESTYQSPYGQDSIVAIASGPDGNLWMTTQENHIDVYIRNIIKASPIKLNFSSPQSTATLTAKDTAWSPKLSAQSSNVGIATVAPGLSADTFVVTSQAVGYCTITIEDEIGNEFQVPVVVQ